MLLITSHSSEKTINIENLIDTGMYVISLTFHLYILISTKNNPIPDPTPCTISLEGQAYETNTVHVSDVL